MARPTQPPRSGASRACRPIGAQRPPTSCLTASIAGNYQIIYSVGGICPASDTVLVGIITTDIATMTYSQTDYCALSGVIAPTVTGASGLFGVLLDPMSDKERSAFFNGLRLFKLGSSWGGFESLMVPAWPAPTRSCTVANEGALIRVHAGLEATADLLRDLEDAFSRLRACRSDSAATQFRHVPA